jgi:hypothetical protein
MSHFTPDRRDLGDVDREAHREARRDADRDANRDAHLGADREARPDADRDVSPAARPGRADAAPLAREARFRAWDGTQSIPPMDADEVLDALRDDLLDTGDLREALARLMERGLRGDGQRPDLPGLRKLLDRLANRRREILEEGRLGDVLADVRRELGEIVDQERSTVDRKSVV